MTDEQPAGAIILVRHALPDVRPGVPSHLWGLSERGREDCVLLAHALEGPLSPHVVTSDEKKAHETATVIALRRGLQVATDPGLREVDRPAAWVEDYRASALAYLGGDALPGWEPRDAVVRRFAAAVERARVMGSGADVVVVTHGLALTLYLAAAAALDPVSTWQALTFPEAWRFDPATGSLARLFAGAAG